MTRQIGVRGRPEPKLVGTARRNSPRPKPAVPGRAHESVNPLGLALELCGKLGDGVRKAA